MDEIEPPQPSRGKNLLGCLVLGVIVLVLIGLILPVININGHEPSRKMQCGKIQSQLIGALVAYTTTENLETWVPADLAYDTTSMGAVRGRAITVRLLESVAVSQSIPNVLFKCPVSAYGGPSKAVKPDPRNPLSQWGWGKDYGISYAFDWAAPFEPGSERVMMADRETKAHNNAAMVVFGDAHVKNYKVIEAATRSSGSWVTEGLYSTPGIIRPQPDDDIYSNEGDAGDPLTPDNGDPLRAWVK